MTSLRLTITALFFCLPALALAHDARDSGRQTLAIVLSLVSPIAAVASSREALRIKLVALLSPGHVRQAIPFVPVTSSGNPLLCFSLGLLFSATVTAIAVSVWLGLSESLRPAFHATAPGIFYAAFLLGTTTRAYFSSAALHQRSPSVRTYATLIWWTILRALRLVTGFAWAYALWFTLSTLADWPQSPHAMAIVTVLMTIFLVAMYQNYLGSGDVVRGLPLGNRVPPPNHRHANERLLRIREQIARSGLDSLAPRDKAFLDEHRPT